MAAFEFSASDASRNALAAASSAIGGTINFSASTKKSQSTLVVVAIAVVALGALYLLKRR